MIDAHTPGPWVVSDLYADDEGQPELAISAKVDGKDCHPAVVCLQFPKMQGMQMANARLIAAAPDLLAACRRAVCGLAYASIDHSVYQDDYEFVSAAIAKATGSTK